MTFETFKKNGYVKYFDLASEIMFKKWNEDLEWLDGNEPDYSGFSNYKMVGCGEYANYIEVPDYDEYGANRVSSAYEYAFDAVKYTIEEIKAYTDEDKFNILCELEEYNMDKLEDFIDDEYYVAELMKDIFDEDNSDLGNIYWLIQGDYDRLR